jgi:3-deoxy-7-phosphoheptulonate synthase
MIIPKAPELQPAELAEVEAIVQQFKCKIQVIHGEHRKIYAIIGDERSETMVNRLLGLAYVDRVDRMESLYKLMDVRSDLCHHRVRVGNVVLRDEPLFIAGHCTIDPQHPELFYETAEAVRDAGAHALRGGVWKPRTSPHSFQGTDASMQILIDVGRKVGLPVVTEIMDEHQLGIALEAGVDIIQIGARNALNYSLLRAVGLATAEKGTPVLLKRSLHMGAVDEFISAAEYIVSSGNPNVLFCPRGTLPKLEGYRNHPDESIAPLLHGRSWAPVVVDPSHSVGRAQFVPSCALAAMAYGADGLVIECHSQPRYGIGDDPLQSISPSVLRQLIGDARSVWQIRRKYAQ